MNTKIIGYGFACVYCLATAVSLIMIHKVNLQVNPILAAFMTFLFSAIWFNLLNARHLISTYKKACANMPLLFKVNLSTGICWLALFISLDYISPLSGNALFMGLMPLITNMISIAFQQKRFQLKRLALGLLIILTTFFLIFDMEHASLQTKHLIPGVILMIISTIGAAFYLFYTQRYQQECHLTTGEVLSVRFYLLIALSFLICLFHHSFANLLSTPYLQLFLLAIFTSIIPLYALQNSISKIGPIKFSLIIPSTMIYTYLLLVILGYPHTWLTFLILVVQSSLLVVYNLIN